MAKAKGGTKRLRKVNGTRHPEIDPSSNFAKSISKRTVLEAIRREQAASHASLTSRIDFLLGQIK